MSQDVRNNRVAIKPLTQEIPNQPRSMDAAADRLMDDVFAEVDVMLSSGGELPIEPPKQEYVTMQQIAVPRINMPPTMQSRQTEAVPNAAKKPQKPEKSGNSLEKWLLVAACTSLGITLLLWLASSGRLSPLFGANSNQTSVAQKTVSPADIQFMDYMQRSLDRFDQNPQTAQEQAATPQAPSRAANAQLPVPFPGTLPTLSGRPQSVLERVYIPVAPRVQTVYVNPSAPQPAPSPQATRTQNARPTTPATRTQSARPTAPAPRTSNARPTAPAPMSRPAVTASLPTASANRVAPIEAPRPTALGAFIGPPLPRQSVSASRPPIPVPVPRTTTANRSAPATSPRPTLGASLPAVAPPRPTVVASLPSAPPPLPRQTVAASRPAVAPSPRPTVAASRPAVAPSPRPTVVASLPSAPPPSPRATIAASRRRNAPVPAATEAATSSSTQPTPRTESTQASASQPAIRHVLQGVLKSQNSATDAALFQVNGTTRRVTVGESISSSGWTLVEINNGEAVIRRNGEVRSIYAGQEF